MHISDQKNELRSAIEHRLKSLSDKERNAESRTVCRELLKAIPDGKTICAYIALKTEVNLTLLLEELLARGQEIYLPVYENKLVYRRFTKDTPLIKGELGIQEPPLSEEELDPMNADIILIPGRAFDRTGNRMGRGNAGYDRWIKKQRVRNPDTQYWGIALECQVMNEVPSEPHDEVMDKLITARGILNCSEL